MLALRKILVPVDFSDPSKKAISYGLSLALELNATLSLAHIVPYSVPSAYAYPVETHGMTKTEMDQIKTRLRQLVEEEYREAVRSEVIVRAGNIEDELLGIINEETTDLVVMGTHGRRRFERWLLGSVTEHILRKALVPMLTVSHLDSDHEIGEPRPIPLRKLLYATDLLDTSQSAMEMALDLTRKFSAELVVLHVMPELQWAYGPESIPLDIEADRDKVRRGLLERLETAVPEPARNDPRIRTELVEGVPYEEILRLADQEKADIIVLNTQSKSGLERALLGSTAERIVRGAHVPVLSVPPTRNG